jgi:hypothetical protein
MHARLVAFLGVTAVTAAVVAATAVAAAPTVWTTVNRDVTTTQYFPPEPNDCGFGGATEIKHYTIEMNHLTQNADGSFHFVDFETGTVTIDWDDPSMPDQTAKLTNTFHANFTPGETFTASETYRQRDKVLTIREHITLVVVDGVPKVERERFFFSGCP